MATTYPNFGIVDPGYEDPSATWRGYHSANWATIDSLLSYIVIKHTASDGDNGPCELNGQLIWFLGPET